MKYFAYIRVSTEEQKDVSPKEQRAAIERYAQSHNLDIVAWFEEYRTAAKEGRPAFTQMMKALTNGQADGLIFHKLDRSMRNFSDWTAIGRLIDRGVPVRFVSENIDVHSRSGRLTADLLAAVAVDFIRNLKEEVSKGIRGRLKQGLLPFQAPVRYLNNGEGKAKTIDPHKGPLVRRAFELYASGRYSLDSLAVELRRLGLRNTRGTTLVRDGLSKVLNNPFYTGLIRIKKTNETYAGVHKPLISMTLFKQVQQRLAGKARSRGWAHEFVFRGLFTCAICGRILTGEIQKGHRYYRCHTRGCQTRTFREEVLEAVILASWPQFVLSPEERDALSRELDLVEERVRHDENARHHGVDLQLASVQERHTRLVDALVDGLIDKATFEQRANGFLNKRCCYASLWRPPRREWRRQSNLL